MHLTHTLPQKGFHLVWLTHISRQIFVRHMTNYIRCCNYYILPILFQKKRSTFYYNSANQIQSIQKQCREILPALFFHSALLTGCPLRLNRLTQRLIVIVQQDNLTINRGHVNLIRCQCDLADTSVHIKPLGNQHLTGGAVIKSYDSLPILLGVKGKDGTVGLVI